MSASVAIMAHPARRHFVDHLILGLDRHAAVVWDHHNDRWDTGRRALLAFDPNKTHHIVLQDDAIICRDFVAGAEKAAAIAGPHPVGLYIGRVRPFRKTVSELVTKAEQRGERWFIHEGPWWGVAIAVPTADIEDLVAWCDARTDIENYDRRISRYYGSRDLKCWYTVPSLVDHRSVDESPSLIRGRVGNRRAHTFIGTEESALDIDWTEKIGQVEAA